MKGGNDMDSIVILSVAFLFISLVMLFAQVKLFEINNTLLKMLNMMETWHEMAKKQELVKSKNT